MAGVEADSVIVSSPELLTATWSKGIPPVTEESIKLWFQNTENYVELYYAKTSDITFSIELSITPEVTEQSCSFAGGCMFYVQGSGLATMMEADKGTISICDEVCEY
jgi:hypothetical protein